MQSCNDVPVESVIVLEISSEKKRDSLNIRFRGGVYKIEGICQSKMVGLTRKLPSDPTQIFELEVYFNQLFLHPGINLRT